MDNLDDLPFQDLAISCRDRLYQKLTPVDFSMLMTTAPEVEIDMLRYLERNQLDVPFRSITFSVRDETAISLTVKHNSVAVERYRFSLADFSDDQTTLPGNIFLNYRCEKLCIRDSTNADDETAKRLISWLSPRQTKFRMLTFDIQLERDKENYKCAWQLFAPESPEYWRVNFTAGVQMTDDIDSRKAVHAFSSVDTYLATIAAMSPETKRLLICLDPICVKDMVFHIFNLILRLQAVPQISFYLKILLREEHICEFRPLSGLRPFGLPPNEHYGSRRHHNSHLNVLMSRRFFAGQLFLVASAITTSNVEEFNSFRQVHETLCNTGFFE